MMAYCSACVRVIVSLLTDRPEPYPVIHAVANPVRGLLDRKKDHEEK